MLGTVTAQCIAWPDLTTVRRKACAFESPNPAKARNIESEKMRGAETPGARTSSALRSQRNSKGTKWHPISWQALQRLAQRWHGGNSDRPQAALIVGRCRWR